MAAKDKEKDDDKAAAAPAGSGKKKIILLVVLGLVLVGISVGGTFAVLKMMAPPAKEEGHDKEAEHGAEGEHAAAASYVDLKPPFIVNFQAGGKTRYLQLELSLMTMDPVATEQMNVHLPLIRNTILMVLNQQDIGDLQTPEGKEALRAAILEKVRALLEKEIKKPVVEQVFFTGFVMQ